MSYEVTILRRAVKELAQLPQKDGLRVEADIEALGSHPRPHGSRKLTLRISRKKKMDNWLRLV